MSARDQAAPKWQKYLTILTGVVTLLVVVMGLQWGRPVLIPIATAALFTLLLSPVVQRLERFGIHHIPAVLLTVTLVSLALGGLAGLMATQVTRLLADLPRNTETIKAKIRSLRQIGSGPTAQRFGQMIDEINAELTPQQNADGAAVKSAPARDAGRTPATPAPAEAPTSLTLITAYVGSAIEVLGATAFAVVLLVFFLLEGRELRDRIVVLAGKARLSVTSKALQDIGDRITRYLGMVAVINGGFGLLLSGMLFLLGMPYAILWGFVAGLLRFIPYIGPWVGALFPIMMSLALSQGWWQPVGVLAVVVILELVTNNVVEPLLFGRTTGVSPTALLICAGFWLYLWGPLGLVLSIPFAVCLTVIGKYIPELSFLNLLLGDEPALTADASFYQRLMLGDAQEALAVAATHLRSPEARNLYDDLLIPTLSRAKADLKRKLLTAEEYRVILDLMRGSLTQLHDLIPEKDNDKDKELAGVPADDARRMTVVGFAALDEADRLALEILQQALDSTKQDVEITTWDEPASTLAARLRADHPALICITSVSPGDVQHCQRLCKQLRDALPDVPIVIGRWGSLPGRRIFPLDWTADEASTVTSSALETCQAVRSHLNHMPATDSQKLDEARRAAEFAPSHG